MHHSNPKIAPYLQMDTVDTGGWKPTYELKFVNGRLFQKWCGDLRKVMLDYTSLCPKVEYLQDQEWREVPGQEP
jgi:hypothetical protein